ncbi:hypothetical protein BIW11_08320 [Tropilaelaps mercedesae]|uniref:Uncharacterized protein n=1 Tax=Tropilaelaps mercedesae TaxID=418985 RepID=A0A1V9XQ22_9ACAR|nr:hypothetical protein BIW11_08320 [Tropilaelaps mercedesae]
MGVRDGPTDQKYAELDELCADLKPWEKDYILLRMELVLKKIDRQCLLQRRQLQADQKTLPLVRDMDAMQEQVNGFKGWLLQNLRSKASAWDLDRLIELRVSPRSRTTPATLAALDAMMELLPNELTIECRRCEHCEFALTDVASSELHVLLSHGNDTQIATCVRGKGFSNIVQMMLKPHDTLDIRVRGPAFTPIGYVANCDLARNSVDPISLLGYGSMNLFCKPDTELLLIIRLWTRPDAELEFQEAALGGGGGGGGGGNLSSSVTRALVVVSRKKKIADIDIVSATTKRFNEVRLRADDQLELRFQNPPPKWLGMGPNKRRIMEKLEREIRRLETLEREWLHLRVEFLLEKIIMTLRAQHASVKAFDDSADLLVTLDDSMQSTEAFQQWFRQCIECDEKNTIENYLRCGVGISQDDSRAVRKILSQMMYLLPRWLNADIEGCFCAKQHLLLELRKGYRVSMLQGTRTVFADFNADDVREDHKAVLQISLDPCSPMQITVYVRHTGLNIFAFFGHWDRTVYFDESFDPVTLLGFEGSLCGRGKVEVVGAVRLWPTPDCETQYQELLTERTFNTTTVEISTEDLTTEKSSRNSSAEETTDSNSDQTR